MAAAIALPVTKACPACGSEKTTVIPYKGIEKLFGLATKLLKYRCVTCGESFHAADRRRLNRTRNSNSAQIIRR